MRVTFFNAEYANTKNKAICQIGILSRDIDVPKATVEKFSLYVSPETPFDDNCVKIHGITAETVKGAPIFPEVWKKIEHFFTNSVVIGHNMAASDLDALHKNLSRYQIELPEIYYICTYQLAQQLVPSFAVRDYSLETLCSFFGIATVGGHNAFYDACACSDLLDRLASYSHVDLTKEIQRFAPHETEDFISYIASVPLKKDIHALYGMIRGFSMDSVISEAEVEYIKNWRESFEAYRNHPDVQKIVETIDIILKDKAITLDEIEKLQQTIRAYLDLVSTSAVTLATQILNGIIGGIVEDEEISEQECHNLRAWLYENNYLAGHFPFDKLFEKLERVLQDGILTEDEANSIETEINALLHPVNALQNEAQSLKGKRICLSGNFSFGKKSAVEKYVIEQGGILEGSVTQETDMLVVGDLKTSLLTRNAHAKTIEKAVKYNDAGARIQISKAGDILSPGKSFRAVLFDFITKRDMDDADVYKRAGLTRQMMSKIRAQERTGYLPSKSSICAFALALQLNLEEANALLQSAGYILSRSFEMDRLIEDHIQNGNYNVDEVNEKLYDMGLPCLGAK